MSTTTQQSSTANRDVFNTGGYSTEPNTVALKRKPNWALVTPALAGSTTALTWIITRKYAPKKTGLIVGTVIAGFAIHAIATMGYATSNENTSK